MAIKFATQVWNWQTDPKYKSATATLDEIARMGYDGIEGILGPPLYDITTATFMKELSKRGLEVATGGLGRGNPYDSDEHAKIFAEAEKSAKVNQSLGLKVSMTLAPGRSRYGAISRMDDKKFNALVDCWNKVGEIAANHGMKLGIHPDTGTGIWSWQEVVKIMEATNPKYVGLALDPAHIITSGGTTDTIVSIIETYKDRLVYFHLKDAIKPGVSELDPPPSSYIWAQRFREIGHGEIIWPLVFLAIKRAGYSGWMTVELDPAAQNGLVPALSAAISKAYIDAYIKPLL